MATLFSIEGGGYRGQMDSGARMALESGADRFLSLSWSAGGGLFPLRAVDILEARSQQLTFGTEEVLLGL